jgi:hypothetical protein
MSNDQRKDERFDQKQNAKPEEINDEDLEPVVGGARPPVGGTEPVCLTSP